MKVAEKGPGTEPLASGVCDDFLGRGTLADTMNIGAEPREQAAKLAAPDFVLQRMLTRIGLCQLRRVEAAQRIGREISEHAERPMHILEDAFAV